MNTNQPINLFSHPLIDQQFFGQLIRTQKPVLQIHSPLPKSNHQAFCRVQLELELTAKSDLPPEWLKNHLSIWLVGQGRSLNLEIMEVVERRLGQDGDYHFHVKTWPVVPIPLDQFSDVHLMSTNGQLWSSPLDPPRIQKANHT